MKVNIFYSWQSNSPADGNWHFIREAIQQAINALSKDPNYEHLEITLQESSAGEPGSPSIINIIEQRIAECQIFIGDVTFNYKLTAEEEAQIPEKIRDKLPRSEPNGNVLFEYGQAFSKLGYQYTISVLNEHFGKAENNTMLFDLLQKRWPIMYRSPIEGKTREELVSLLSEQLRNELKKSIDYGIKNPGWPNYPFLDIERWGSVFQGLTVEFILTPKLEQRKADLLLFLKSENRLIRVVGLSGLGKTRLVYEAAKEMQKQSRQQSHRILYLDLNTIKDEDYKKVINQLAESNESYWIILDNCDISIHNLVAPLVSKPGSKLSMLTIDYNPLYTSIERESFPILIELEQDDYRPIIDEILFKYFPGPNQSSERELIKNFANGHTLVATILAESKATTSNDGWRPVINNKELLNKLIGQTDNANIRSSLRIVGIFKQLGHFEQLKKESEFVCTSSLFTKFAIPDEQLAINHFNEVCNEYRTRGIIEKQGRYIRIRTIPIALSLAVEWWMNISPEAAERVFNALDNFPQLANALSEQLKYLDFLENAREIIERFVDVNGPLGKAEVINTSKGSQLFRLFVEVNPIACAEALDREFGGKNTEELLHVKAGRRNLIWALEKLAFKSETFDQSSKLLARLAVAENENISNNARGQFLQLFSIMLPGTEVSLKTRIVLMQFIYIQVGAGWEELYLEVLNRALKSEGFTRMGGAETVGSMKLEDYRPTWAELKEYWEYCTDSLMKLLHKGNSKALDILLDRTRGLVSMRLSYLALKIYSRILDEFPLKKIEVIKSVSRILKFEKHRLSKEEFEHFQDLTAVTSSYTFGDIYQSTIKDSIFLDLAVHTNLEEQINAKVIDVVERFINENLDFTFYGSLMLTGQQHYGFLFGKELAKRISNENKVQRFNELLEAYKQIKEAPDASIICGYMTELDNSLKFILFKKLVEVPHLKEVITAIASSINPNTDILDFLLTEANQRKIEISAFGNFIYGSALSSLSAKELYDFVKQLSKLEDTPLISFSILYMNTFRDSEKWHITYDLLKEMIDKIGIPAKKYNAMFNHYWSESIVKIFEHDRDEEFARRLSKNILLHCQSPIIISSTSTDFDNIIPLLLRDYFTIFWEVINPGLLSDNYVTFYNLKSLLGSEIDPYKDNISPLFKIRDLAILRQWLLQNGVLAAKRLAGLVPIFSTEEPKGWFSLTRFLIDNFGDNIEVLNAINANMNTFSSVGTVIPYYEDQTIVFKDLYEHPIDSVRKWARANVVQLELLIKEEKNRDDEALL